MRPSMCVASLLLAVGCAQPPLVQTAVAPSDAPLEVRLHQPIGGTLHYTLNEPAYVAIFAVSRGYGISLVFPHYQSQMDHRSHPGLNQETVHGGRGAWAYSTVSRYEGRVFGNTDAYYIIASKSPLPVEAFLQSPHVLRSLLGERTFRANNFTETWNALEELLVARLPHDHWASDAFVTWRDPFLSVAYSEPTLFQCAGSRSFYIPGLLASAYCDPGLGTTGLAPTPAPQPPMAGPIVGIPKREPPREPRDREPSIPLDAPLLSRLSRNAERGEQSARPIERERTASREQPQAPSRPAEARPEPSRPPERAPAAREPSPAPARPADTRPQEPARDGDRKPDPQPDS